MFYRCKSLEWVSLIPAHMCTLALAVSFNSTWRVPLDGFRYGGLTYGLALTVAMITVALPLVSLHLTLGQLCQQDVVGMWRAVPFFKGVGYLRLLISFVGVVYTVIYLGVVITCFFYTIRNFLPLWDCEDVLVSSEHFESMQLNSSLCLNSTVIVVPPITDAPESYVSVALIMTVLWISCPFLLYTPVKMMKKIFYICTPSVIILGITVLSYGGVVDNIYSFYKSEDWQNFLEPRIWHGALTQALWTSQMAGGYLVVASDTVYEKTNVKWCSLTIIGVNIFFHWAGLLFWFSISGSETNQDNVFRLITLTYSVAQNKSQTIAWPLLVFAMIFFSGTVSLLSFLHPLYERCRAIGGRRWRIISVSCSLIGLASSLAVLAGGGPVIEVLDDIATPLLVSVATTIEICAFIFIYGLKVLVKDVEFLTGQDLANWWVLGWCAAPGVVVPLTLWWVVTVVVRDSSWLDPPWEACALITALLVTFALLLVCATFTVQTQVQFDYQSKLYSSFKPSRHWGPRDPITHYYWMARRRNEVNWSRPRTVYRRQLGQFSGHTSTLHLARTPPSPKYTDTEKKRANSDDWIYTVYRRKFLKRAHKDDKKLRSKSIDWPMLSTSKHTLDSQSSIISHSTSSFITPQESLQSVKEDSYKEFFGLDVDLIINNNIK